MNNQESITRIPPLILAIIIIQIAFIAIIINTISKEATQKNEAITRDDQSSITIGGLSLYSMNLPNNYIDDISHSLTKTIESNNSNLNVSNSDVIVRDGTITIKQFEKQQFNALSFIVDIPNLEQSYQVYYKYPANLNINIAYYDNPRAILCIDDPSQIIFPTFQCSSDYPPDTRLKIVKDYLSFFEFDVFSTSIDKDNPHQINLKGFHRAIDHLDDSHIAQVKNAISSLGISPDLFTYHIKTE